MNITWQQVEGQMQMSALMYACAIEAQLKCALNMFDSNHSKELKHEINTKHNTLLENRSFKMKIEHDPYFKKNYTRKSLIMFLMSALLFIVNMAALIYAGRSFSGFDKTIYFKLGVVFCFFIIVFVFVQNYVSLYRVACLRCKGKTKVKKKTKELPNTYSAYCKNCDVLWDLGLDNDAE
jgi:hypothetical protein